MTTKKVHLHWFFGISAAGLLSVLISPELVKDAPTTLGTIGVFATAFGVVFAVIEVQRAKAAFELAQTEAKKVFSRLTELVTAREIAECQAVLGTAVAAIDENKPIPSSTLCTVVKLYSQVFHAELSNPESTHRQNRSIIESYAHNPNNTLVTLSGRKTKKALLSIAGHLAQLQGLTKVFSEED